MPHYCPCSRSGKFRYRQGLIDATVKAAILLAARDAGEAGLVSASAVALTEGVLRTMLVSKLKMTAAILLAVGALTSGVGLYAYQDSRPAHAPNSHSLPAKVNDQNAEELDDYAARVEQLVRRARQEQSGGAWDRAVTDLRKTACRVGEWRDALIRRQVSEKAQYSPRPTPAGTVPVLRPARAQPALPIVGSRTSSARSTESFRLWRKTGVARNNMDASVPPIPVIASSARRGGGDSED